jgi:hypothetical protein
MVFYKEANLETLNTSQAPPTTPGHFAWLSDDGYIGWEGWEHGTSHFAIQSGIFLISAHLSC